MRMFKFPLKIQPLALEPARLPRHIAFIMDGNGRWAKRRGLARSVGHAEGSRQLKEVVKDCYNLHIRYVSVYAFSSENWKRPKEEVDQLMKLLLEYLRGAIADLENRKVRSRELGSRDGQSREILRDIAPVDSETAAHQEMDFLICINYGGRQELVQAARRIAAEAAAGTLKPEDVDEACIADRLYTAGIPDPDLLIRTSGEQRLSNFMPWQTAYTEFLFPDVLWPDFRERHLREALNAYVGRNRRFGGVTE